MEQSNKSEGKCLFCGKTFSKAAINRHLKMHLEQKTTEKPKIGKSYLVKVGGSPLFFDGKGYFLSLWVDGTAKMQDLDDFLRDIWLECCGHCSVFTNPAIKKIRFNPQQFLESTDLSGLSGDEKMEKYMEAWDAVDKESDNEIPMDKKVNKVFHKDLKLKYEYDFGSSTYLQLAVVDEYPVKADDDIVLLSRNEPLDLLCDLCKKEPATQVCTVHIWNGGDNVFCDKCAKKHAKTCPDFADYSSLPVVNSPRMGMCCYDGGHIDLERDIFVKNVKNKQDK